MEIFTKANGMRAKGMVMVCSLREMVIISKAIGSTISEKDKDLTSTRTKISFSLVSGLMTNRRPVCTQRSKMRKLKKAQRDLTSKTHIYFHQFQN